MVKDDLAVLRNFRGDSSLATYLTVVARRVVVRELLKQPASVPMHGGEPSGIGRVVSPSTDRAGDRQEIERLLEELDGAEAEIVRMYHLEGKSYHEISTAVGMPENSVGPTLSRAQTKCVVPPPIDWGAPLDGAAGARSARVRGEASQRLAVLTSE